jgi:hypothetical protein
VFDNRHVVRAVCGSEPCEIVMEDDIEHPVQPVASRPEGLHLRPLSERSGSLSTHTAPIKQTRLPSHALEW